MQLVRSRSRPSYAIVSMLSNIGMAQAYEYHSHTFEKIPLSLYFQSESTYMYFHLYVLVQYMTYVDLAILLVVQFQKR